MAYSLVAGLSSPISIYIMGGDDYDWFGFIGAGYQGVDTSYKYEYYYYKDIYIVNQVAYLCSPPFLDQTIFGGPLDDIGMDAIFIVPYEYSHICSPFHYLHALVIGFTNSPSGGDNYAGFIIKVDDTLSLVWSYYYTLDSLHDIYFKDIERISPDRFAINGSICSFGECRPLVVLLDSSGNVIWAKVIGSMIYTTPQIDGDITYNSQYGYIDIVRTVRNVTTPSGSEVIWVRLDTLGNIIFEHILYGLPGGSKGRGIDFLEDDTMYVIAVDIDTCSVFLISNILGNITHTYKVCPFSPANLINISDIVGHSQNDFVAVGWLESSGYVAPLFIEKNPDFIVKYLSGLTGKFHNVNYGYGVPFVMRGYIEYYGIYKPFIDDPLHDTCFIYILPHIEDSLMISTLSTSGYMDVSLLKYNYNLINRDIYGDTLLCPYRLKVNEDKDNRRSTYYQVGNKSDGIYDKSGRKVHNNSKIRNRILLRMGRKEVVR